MIRFEQDKKHPLNECKRRQRQTFCDKENVNVFDTAKHLYSWRRIAQTICIPSRIQKISQWNRCKTFLKNWFLNNQMRSMELRQLTGKTLHGSICLWLVAKMSSVSCTQVYVFSDSVLCFGKKNENPPSNIACADRLTWFPKFTRRQSFGHNWWWANGIRVEYLPKIQHVATQSRSSRVTVKIERNRREIYWTAHLHVDVQRHLMEIERQQERMRIKCSTHFSIYKKIRRRTKVISWSWFQRKMVFCQWRQSTKWGWQNGRKDYDNTRRKPSVSSHESNVQRSALKQRRWKFCLSTIVPTKKRLQLFFAQLVL